MRRLLPLFSCLFFIVGGPAAGQPAQADLSLSVVVTPSTFVAGGRNRVALTVHNAGPDLAGGGTESSISVASEFYIINTRPPPYEVVEETAQGCWVERFVTEPLPDNSIALLFAYYFDSIPAGQSRTCTYEIEYYPSTHPPLPLEWTVFTWYTDVDPDPSNNTLRYTLEAQTVLPVPSGSGWSAIGLIGVVIGLGLWRLRPSRCRSVA
ncbi:hypothetical protein [Dokdonella koreensis]|uniref:hypothetical protein n=1 Tax=Dokdonella koreensis TaxID=323415 RepID=UPI0008309F02|nr:hypothetical protein [Dokdonella koreensis]